METDADRLEYLKALGEQVSIDEVETWCIYEAEFVEELADPGFASSAPTILCRTIDVEDVLQSAVVERDNGEKYRIREPEPDGTGMTLFRLTDYA